MLSTSEYPRISAGGYWRGGAWILDSVRPAKADIRHFGPCGCPRISADFDLFQVRQSQHAMLPNHKSRQTSPWLAWFPAPHLSVYFARMHGSARKRLRKNKSKTSSDNSQSSGDELIQINASESSEDVVSDVADEYASESKAKHVVSKKKQMLVILRSTFKR
jgi:hypothetical protein